MIDYPGGINQDMLFNVWLQNPLIQGSIQLKDKNRIEKYRLFTLSWSWS